MKRDFQRIKHISYVISSLPPCVRYAVIACWSNVWNTAGRFQRTEPCIFCDSPGGSDHIEHYCICPVVWRFLIGKMRLDLNRSSYNFLIPHAASDNDILLWACSMYAFSSYINNFNGGSKEWNVICVSLWGHCKIASLFSNKLKVLLRGIH